MAEKEHGTAGSGKKKRRTAGRPAAGRASEKRAAGGHAASIRFDVAARFDVAVIGAGPAGMAAALAADKAGARVLLIDREERPGGILKQCIHDGFGLVRFGRRMAGPEYAQVFIDELAGSGVAVSFSTFVTDVSGVQPADKSGAPSFRLTLVTKNGLRIAQVRALVLATGCRERTARQIGVHGTRPAGVLTAGAAQYYTNILGMLPGRRCVILGSGDIGLIMARRLTLEGARVLGIYEAKPTPGGLSRNLAQCLDDFGIPLYTSHTVTRVFGIERLTAVEIAEVDACLRPIAGTERRVACDCLILSVGLIPENELAESLDVPLDPRTHGPVADQRGMTLHPGIFTCGNAWQVNDLVDYVTENSAAVGKSAAEYALAAGRPGGEPNASGETPEERLLVTLTPGEGIQSLAPQCLDLTKLEKGTVVWFRAAEERGRSCLRVSAGDRELFSRTYRQLRPPEMERLLCDFTAAGLRPGDTAVFSLADIPKQQSETAGEEEK